MPLIKNGIETTDDWILVADDAELPADGKAVVSLKRWQEQKAQLEQRNAPLGLSLPNTAAPEELNGDVHRFALIALNFPKFSDGRAYSQARVLREHLGYQGELRATGQVLRDQLLYMHRAGFDAFEINRPDAEKVFKAALQEMTVFYQPTSDDRATAQNVRLGLQQRLARKAGL